MQRPPDDAQKNPASEAAAGAVKAALATDEALNAIVYDVHPALAQHSPDSRHEDGYPYSRSSSQAAEFDVSVPTSAPPNWTTAALMWADRWAARIGQWRDQYVYAINRPADFVVPKTFGMAAILGLTTVLAVLFSILRWAGAYPVFYFFFVAEAMGICLAQMLYGHAPRMASIVMGAILLPVFTIVALLFTSFGPGDMLAAACLLLAFVPVGACLGYLTGTCAAGTFLVMDYVEQRWQTGAFSFTRRKG